MTAAQELNGASAGAPDALDFLTELKSHQDDLKTATGAFNTQVSAFKEMAEGFETKTAEDRELIVKLGENIAALKQSQEDHESAIEALSTKLTKQPVSKADHVDEVRKSAVAFFRNQWITDESKSVEEIQSWDEDKHVNEDKIKGFELARNGLRKMFRAPASVPMAESYLTHDEQVALKTLNTGQGNLYWLTDEISQEVIECFEERTDIGSLVSSETISRNKITYPVEVDDLDEAEWMCETDCDPGIANLTLDNILSIEAHEIRRAVCATHQMIEDSLKPIESYVARRVGRQFTNARNRAFMIGDGVKKPLGMLNADMNVMQTTNKGANPGDISWQDFALMFGLTQEQFVSGSEWWMSRNAFAHVLTLADANNRPIIGSLTDGGTFSLYGLPVRINTYMPDYVDLETGEKINGSCPIMLINPRRLYRAVNRIGVSVTRDPLSRAACGVIWHFRARFGGGTLCPNAATKLCIATS